MLKEVKLAAKMRTFVPTEQTMLKRLSKRAIYERVDCAGGGGLLSFYEHGRTGFDPS